MSKTFFFVVFRCEWFYLFDEWHGIPGQQTLHISLFFSYHQSSCLLRNNSWDNNELWHLIEGSTTFLLWCFLCDAFLCICSTSALTTYQSHFAKYGICCKEHERSLSFPVNEKLRWKLTFIVMEMENTGETLPFNALTCWNLGTVIFDFDSNFKFMSIAL